MQVEPEVYASGLHGALPSELRAPRLYAMEELPGDRARIWIEDIASGPILWDHEAYACAAFALGRLAGRYPADAIPWTFTPKPWDLHGYLEGRVGAWVIPALADDTTWSHPLVRAAVDADLRADLWWLWQRGHQLASLADRLAQTLGHGDACPQDLLRGASPGAFVAIDWGLTGTSVVGADLVQLIAGRADTGELAAPDVAELLEIALGSFDRGLDAEGMAVARRDLDLAVDVSLVVRCAFTALPVERLGGLGAQPHADELVRQRAGWCRFLVDRRKELLAKSHKGNGS